MTTPLPHLSMPLPWWRIALLGLLLAFGSDQGLSARDPASAHPPARARVAAAPVPTP